MKERLSGWLPTIKLVSDAAWRLTKKGFVEAASLALTKKEQ